MATRLGAAAEIPLLTWDGAATHPVRTVDDPVMGGGSESFFRVDAPVGVWEGEVKIVSFLQAPGFCTLRSESGLFPDVRRTQALELRLRGSSGLQNYSLQE
ncbi:hypothetical protein T492DRAFT_836759 [Pavlovales sp. CCMP2436]|nr:hypothetical protein T492DRAFT_836759 [Pavlovales sp. CCMP2436]